MVGALLLQSGMGAWAVKYPQSAAMLALHFGFSLVAVAGVFLVMRVIDEQSSGRYVAETCPTARVHDCDLVKRGRGLSGRLFGRLYQACAR